MDINRLDYFCTIVKTGSLKEAAKLLHLSPAALSKAVRILEEELSAKLLIPSGRGIAVTDYGKDVAKRAEHLIGEFRKLRVSNTKESSSTQSGTLKIGSFEVFTTHFLGALLEKGFSECPLKLYELTPGKLEEAVSQGTVDFGLTYLPIPKADLDFMKITKIEMGIYGLKGKFRNPVFSELPFVVPVTPVVGTPTRVAGLDGWPDHLAPRKITYEVTLLESALELCRGGFAVAYLPKFVVRLHNPTVSPR